MIFKIFKSVLAAFYWSKAVSLTSTGKYKSALNSLDKSEKHRAVFDECFFLLKGYLKGALSDREEMLDLLKKAVFYALENKSELNDDERKYIINYASMLASYADFFDYPFCIFNAFDKENISKHIIDKFPYKIENVSKEECFQHHNYLTGHPHKLDG
jgi:hypothetical protein